MELYEREKALEERERKLELREIELEKISYKLAVTCQTKVNAQEINEQLEVGQLMRRGPGNVCWLMVFWVQKFLSNIYLVVGVSSK